MNTAIQKNAAAALDGYGFDRDKIELIKRTIAPGVTDAELQLFLYTAQRCGLDPLARQIYCIKRNSKDGPKTTIQTSIDGYRLIADRTGNYAPGRAPTFEERDDGTIISATAYVWKCARDTWHEVAATAYWDEYVATYQGKPQNLWATKPHVMISKCAEALALRRAFPAELSGLYTQEEMAEQPAYLDVSTGELVQQPQRTPPPKYPLEEAPRLAANPPTNRVLTPDPAAAKAKLWRTFDAVVREAKALGIKVQDAELLQADEHASEDEVKAMGKALREAITKAKADAEPFPYDGSEDTGSFVEVAENVELFPNGQPA